MTRPVREPGGVLLVALGLSAAELRLAIDALYPEAASLTILVDEENAALVKTETLRADEIWVYAPLGVRGFMALLRRIAWRRFDAVYQPRAQPRWLKYLVRPRPPWHLTKPAPQDR